MNLRVEWLGPDWRPQVPYITDLPENKTEPRLGVALDRSYYRTGYISSATLKRFFEDENFLGKTIEKIQIIHLSQLHSPPCNTLQGLRVAEDTWSINTVETSGSKVPLCMEYLRK